MKVGIIGTGNVGLALGKAWASKGHKILLGSRDPGKARKLAEDIEGNASGGTYEEVTKSGDIIVLAIPWPAINKTLKMMGDLKGKILIDCINPLKPELAGLEVGLNTSASEEIAKLAPEADVIKALNSIGSLHYKDPKFGDLKASGFICGDNSEAKKKVAQLVEDLGFDVVDCGSLEYARLLEPLALLWIKLAYVQGFGPNVAFKLVKK